MRCPVFKAIPLAVECLELWSGPGTPGGGDALLILGRRSQLAACDRRGNVRVTC